MSFACSFITNSYCAAICSNCIHILFSIASYTIVLCYITYKSFCRIVSCCIVHRFTDSMILKKYLQKIKVSIEKDHKNYHLSIAPSTTPRLILTPTVSPHFIVTLLFSHMKVGRYSNHNEFARDIRRCVGNFLHFNFGPGNSKMRRDVIRVLSNFEEKWNHLKTEVRKNSRLCVAVFIVICAV